MSKKTRWSEAEQESLARYYPSISAARLRELISDRTAKAIERQAERIGIQKCHERRREAGAENVGRRWHPEVFKTPETPPQ
jgi:hypothetical protein